MSTYFNLYMDIDYVNRQICLCNELEAILKQTLSAISECNPCIKTIFNKSLCEHGLYKYVECDGSIHPGGFPDNIKNAFPSLKPGRTIGDVILNVKYTKSDSYIIIKSPNLPCYKHIKCECSMSSIIIFPITVMPFDSISICDNVGKIRTSLEKMCSNISSIKVGWVLLASAVSEC